ncbi:MAG TPA: 3-hydroxyacyl-ACP dehydratase FabZ [Woeseiaceae bacterium]
MTTDVTTRELQLDIAHIMRLLPHRYPMLLIDRVSDYVANESLTALKNVSINEPFFQGHFPSRPVMPGVLIIEAMAQAGGILSYMSNQERDPDLIYYLAGVDDARFRRPVVPGDQLEIRVAVETVRRGVWFYNCSAHVDGQTAVKARITCAPGRET